VVKRLRLLTGVGFAWAFVALAPEAGAQGPAPAELAPDLGQAAETAAQADASHRRTRDAAEAQRRADFEAGQEAALAAARDTERAAARELEKALADAHSLEQDLFLLHRDPGATPASTGLLAAPDGSGAGTAGHDPRVASRAPPARELPLDIFDRSDTVIPPGTWQNRESLRVSRLVLDADGDGKPELVRFVDRTSGELVREEADRNYDGVVDAWKNYQGGRLIGRILDENDDGNPDVFETYRAELLVVRELDRDDDGVRDVVYRYRGEALFEEAHDANNDGIVDLLIVYADRRRVRAEEDVDRDGRIDMWTRYADEGEAIARIEHDRAGRGFADTFEYFRNEGGKALLVRREQDIDGDGAVDLVSFYAEGRLRRRQIADSGLLPL